MLSEDYQKIADAIIYAFEAHEGATRKDKKLPYIVHPLRVYASLREVGVTDCAVLVSALLHDTIEDAGKTKEELAQLFGEKVGEYVDYLSDDKSLPRDERKVKVRERLKDAPIEVKLIKIADRLDNVLSVEISGWTDEKKRKYLKESELLIESLTNNLVDDKKSKLIRKFAEELQKMIISLNQQLNP